MTETITTFEYDVLEKLRKLSEDKQQEVLDFVSFLLSRIRPQEPPETTAATSVVEETWGNIPLDKETAMYVAEDKELEYDV